MDKDTIFWGVTQIVLVQKKNAIKKHTINFNQHNFDINTFEPNFIL